MLTIVCQESVLIRYRKTPSFIHTWTRLLLVAQRHQYQYQYQDQYQKGPLHPPAMTRPS
jgi:hypothetical protein